MAPGRFFHIKQLVGESYEIFSQQALKEQHAAKWSDSMVSKNVYGNNSDMAIHWVRKCDWFQKFRDGSEEVDLCLQTIRDEGAKLVARALEHPETKVKSLSLRSNNIGEEGVKAISRALESNSTLASLYLDLNVIGDEGAKAVAKVLESNETLTRIDLGANRIGDEGIKSIAKAMESNYTLTELCFDGNAVAEKNIQQIKALLQLESRKRRAREIAQRKIFKVVSNYNAEPADIQSPFYFEDF